MKQETCTNLLLAGTLAFAGWWFLQSVTITKKGESGCDCGCAKCGEDKSKEAWESEYSLEYINPEPVEQQNDVHGAEAGDCPNCATQSVAMDSVAYGIGTAECPNVVVGYPVNTRCPVCSDGGLTVAPIRGVAPRNPVDSQTIDGLLPSPVRYFDGYNDILPEYRFPFPWNPAYAPADASRNFLDQTAVAGPISNRVTGGV